VATNEASIHSFPAQEPDYIDLRTCPFSQAAPIWLESRRPYISAKTLHEYEINVRTLSPVFGEMRLEEITADQIRAYQRMRQGKCGPSAINHECSVLQQMLKRIGRWSEIAPNYQPLPLPKEKRGRALGEEEKKRLFLAAQSSSNWEAALLFALISVNTTTGPKETATLRLKDIDIEKRLLTVQAEGAKNVHRIRPIPLNEEAVNAVKLALVRARRLGAYLPEHYLFPFRIHRALFDPIRYQTTFKTAWKRMITAADLPGLRMYDLRHHAITVLLESPKVSEETAEAIAGHISREIKKRYSHVRMGARRAAVSALDKSTADLSLEQGELGPLRNADVLEMLNGLPPKIVAAKISSSECSFDTRPETLKQLQSSGVPETVILAMVRAS
jgi:integrase